MAATIYRNVPARRLWNGRIVETPVYRRIMRDIERCLKAGGTVEFSNSIAISAHKQGDIIERITVTIDTTPETEAAE